MSRFREEVSLIPKIGWLIAVVVYLASAAVFVPTISTAPHWPLWSKVLVTALIPTPLFIYALLIAYVNRDAHRRGMRYVLWTLLAIFIPNGIGIILYFLLRDPLLAHCTQCRTQVRSNFAFCPNCGANIAPACPQCRRSVETKWANCPYCGAKL